MKESKLIEMWNRVEILGQHVQQMIQELNNLRDLSVGTMSLVKKFPDYEKALEDLQKDITKEMKTKKQEDNVE
jgi:predicted ATP-grasp superfamily ATP-dependent carboligase